MTTNYKTSFLLPHDYEIPTFNYPQYVLPPKESNESNWKLITDYYSEFSDLSLGIININNMWYIASVKKDNKYYLKKFKKW